MMSSIIDSPSSAQAAGPRKREETLRKKLALTAPAPAKFISIRSLVATLIMLAGSSVCLQGQPQNWRERIERAAQLAPEARMIVLDVGTGRILGAHRLTEAAKTLAAPGSALKPLVLYSLILSGQWRPENRIACDRNLAIGGHRLECSHPQAPPFDAREALAWSCNSYFAEAARALKPGELGRALRVAGLLGPTGLVNQEAIAEFREPRTLEGEQLTVLGVEGIRVSPLELAVAYRRLARQINAHPDSIAARTVAEGLSDSASFGMAEGASLKGANLAGKTGTAEGEASSQTHGWFAGFSPPERPNAVIVVYLPAGRGADAARIAAEVLEQKPQEHR